MRASSPRPRIARGIFAAFLERSLRSMEVECPRAFGALARACTGMRIELLVSGEGVGIASDGERASVVAPGLASQVRLTTHHEVIRELLEANISLRQAVLAERLQLVGAVDDLIAFDAALRFYLEGAARCPSFPILLKDYLSRVNTNEATSFRENRQQ